MSAYVDAKRDEVRENFGRLERRADAMEDGAPRMRALRQIAELKARSAPLMGEEAGLRDFTLRDESGRYQGLDSSDPAAIALKASADARVRVIAERHGVNAEATVERYSGGAPSKGLAAAYTAAEVRERERNRSLRSDAVETAVEREAALTRMHDEIGTVYSEARSRAEREAGVVSTTDVAKATTVSGAAAQSEDDRRKVGEGRERRDEARKLEERRRRERDGGRGL